MKFGKYSSPLRVSRQRKTNLTPLIRAFAPLSESCGILAWKESSLTSAGRSICLCVPNLGNSLSFLIISAFTCIQPCTLVLIHFWELPHGTRLPRIIFQDRLYLHMLGIVGEEGHQPTVSRLLAIYEDWGLPRKIHGWGNDPKGNRFRTETPPCLAVIPCIQSATISNVEPTDWEGQIQGTWCLFQ